jgi:aspartyl protease family protein
VNNDTTASALYSILAIILVASSFAARRVPWRQSLKMLLAWAAIFGVFIVVFSFREEASFAWKRIKSEIMPGTAVNNDGSLTIRKSEDGHFWVDAEINGKPVRLLIDSGATTTGLSLETARAVNVDLSGPGFPVFINTANGTVKATRAKVSSLKIGSIERNDLTVLVAENFGDTNVVGMNFLSSLESWRVEGDELLLNPK